MDLDWLVVDNDRAAIRVDTIATQADFLRESIAAELEALLKRPPEPIAAHVERAIQQLRARWPDLQFEGALDGGVVRVTVTGPPDLVREVVTAGQRG